MLFLHDFCDSLSIQNKKRLHRHIHQRLRPFSVSVLSLAAGRNLTEKHWIG